MKNITVQQRGTITLPKKLREALALKEDSVLRVSEKNGALLLEPPASVDEQVLSDIKQGIEDIKKGKFIEFSSLEEFDTKIDVYEG